MSKNNFINVCARLLSVCTLLLQCDQGCAGAEAVPSCAVVARLEVLNQSFRQHQGGRDPVFTGHCLHRETTGRPRGQTHVPKGPHLWRINSEWAPGLWSNSKQREGLQSFSTLVSCFLLSEKPVPPSVLLSHCWPLRCSRADTAHRLMFKLPSTSALQVRPKEV